jgi:signal transduction histidine kinase
MLKKWCVFLFVGFLFATYKASGQDLLLLNKDSLMSLLKTAREDTGRVLLLIKIGNDYERNQPDSAVYFYKTAGDLSRKIHYDVGVLKYIANYTAVLNMQDKLDESLTLNKQAIELAQKIHNANYLGVAYGNTAAVYELMHMHKLCIEYYLKCIAAFEQLHNEERLAVAYGNLASIYSDIDQNEKAIWYGFKAISISRNTKDEYNLEAALNNTASAFAAIKRYDTALVLYNQAKALGAKLNDQYVLAESLVGISEVLLQKMQLEPMKQNALLAYKASRTIGHKIGMVKSILLLAQYYFEKKKYNIAKKLAETGVSMSVQNQMVETEQKAYVLLSNISLATGDLSAFHNYGNKSNSLDKLMVSNQIIQNTQELEAEYSLVKKEATITDLTKMQQIQQLSLRQGKTLNYVLIASLLTLILAAFLFYRNYTQKKKLLLTESLVQQQQISELEKEKQLIAVKAVLQGQEQERERLARDLHDGLGSILSGVKYNFVSLKEHPATTPETRLALDKNISTLDEATGELRRIAHNLMPEAITKFGLVAALTDFCQSMNREGVLRLNFQAFNVKEEAIPPEIRSVIFRMVQELVQNIIKHAGARNALIQLVGRETDLSLIVEDDGQGFSPQLQEHNKGIGFINIRNRVIFLNGILDVASSPGKGTCITIELPNIII